MTVLQKERLLNLLTRLKLKNEFKEFIRNFSFFGIDLLDDIITFEEIKIVLL